MEPEAVFVVAAVRAHRWTPGCLAPEDAQRSRDGDVDFCVATTSPASEDAETQETSVDASASGVSEADLKACARQLITALGTSATTTSAFDYDDDQDDDDEEEEVFNRELDTIGFRDLQLGHVIASSNTSSSTDSGSLIASSLKASHAAATVSSSHAFLRDTGIYFNLPTAHAKHRTLHGVAVPDPRFKRGFYVQQEVRFLVLLSNVPFQARLRARLEVVAHEFFKQDETLCSFEGLRKLFQELTSVSIGSDQTEIFATLPYRELFVGLPIPSLVTRLEKDVVAVLRALLLEGRIACYSVHPSLASAATLAILALLPGVLAGGSEFSSRTIQAVVYRLRRFGMPFSLFNQDFVHQPCLASESEVAAVYAAQGFLVGISDPMLLKHPNAKLDLILDLDARHVVAFPTRKAEHAFAFGSTTTEFIRTIAGQLSHPKRDVKVSSSPVKPSNPKAAQAVDEPLPMIAGASMAAAHSEIDWILAQFQSYFERFLEEGFKCLFGGHAGSSGNYDPYHPSILSLLEDLAAPVFGEHATFYAEYGRAWTHAWQTTSNYENWISAHRLERRRSTIVTPTAPPASGRADYTYANGDEYEGEFRQGKRHGFGVYVEFVTKNQYEGDWADDQRHGKGILSSKCNGYIYDGEWQHDMRCGRGHSSLKNVETYTGNWARNSFHGSGIYSNADGDIYDGEWCYGAKHGLGKLTIARPKRGEPFGGLKQYVGEWLKGKFHGTGTAHYMDGTEYSGSFQDGKRHGNGLMVLAPADDKYDGQWWKGFRHGEGSWFSAASGITKEGTWRKDQALDGHWFIVYANGDKYAGDCRRGRAWGQGVCKYANGSSYSGAWVDGLREGFGVCVNADGSILEGLWANSVFIKAQRQPAPLIDVSLTEGPSVSASPRRRSSLSIPQLPPPESGSHSYVYANGDAYDGEFQNALRHGFGVFTERASGNVYEGEWVCNERSGSGVLTSGMKDFLYDGQWVNDMRNGFGHCVIRGCETYSGQWRNNQFHGMGKYIDAEGHVYEGEFAFGRKHGMGKQQQQGSSPSLTGEQYIGEWKDGYRDGIGDAVFADGSTYSGTWAQDQRHGEGTFTSPHGSEKYVGQWCHGMKDGAGILSNNSTGVTKEGCWEADEPLNDGEWTITFPDGSKFTGQCLKSRPHGRGVCKYANGDLYDGQWVHGKRHGLGTGFFANGESFVGQWENNHVALNGKGQLTLADGTVHVYAS